MSFLITGGMGALGSAIARDLVKRGEKPILFCRHEDYTLVSDIKSEVVYAQGDMLNIDDLNRTIKKYGVTCIIHTAALLSVIDPRVMVPSNTRGTENILWAAKDNGIKRVVYISSKAVYDNPAGEYAHPVYKLMNEDYSKNTPSGFYGVTKYYGELLGRQFERKYGIEFISIRFATMYGPGRLLKNPESPMTLPCRIIEDAMLHKPFKWDIGGDQVDDLISYEDSAQGVALAATVAHPKSRIYNIGTGVGFTLKDIAKATKSLYPDFEYEIGPGLNYRRSPEPAGSYSIYDISRAVNELNYKPTTNLEVGITRYVDTMKRLKIEPKYVV